MSGTPTEVERAAERTAWLRFTAIPFVLYGISVALAPAFLNHDAALYLVAARLLLEGQMPYVDFVDPNPPMVIYLSVLPAGLAKCTGWPEPLAFHLVLMIASAACAAAFYSVLRKLHADGAVPELSFVLFAAMSGWFALGWDGAGQREHVFLLAFLPFAALRWWRWERTESEEGAPRSSGPGRMAAACVGFAAGVAGCLKPYFLLLLAVPDLCRIVMTRRRGALSDPENLAAFLAVLLYTGHFALVPAPMREAYFGRWLPLTWTAYDVYDAMGEFSSVVRHAQAYVIVALVTLLTRAWMPPAASRLAAVSALFTLVGAANFYLQHKGWNYHLIPAAYGALACGALCLLNWRIRSGARPVLPAGVTRVGIAALLVVLQLRCLPSASENPYSRAILERSSPGDAVLFLSTSVFPMFPALAAVPGRSPGSRYLLCFPLAMAYRGWTALDGRAPYRLAGEARPEAETSFLTDLRQDVGRRRPRLIFVGRGQAQGCPPGFVLAEYFRACGFWAEIEPYYRRSGSVGSYELYERIGASAKPAAATPHGDIRIRGRPERVTTSIAERESRVRTTA